MQQQVCRPTCSESLRLKEIRAFDMVKRCAKLRIALGRRTSISLLIQALVVISRCRFSFTTRRAKNSGHNPWAPPPRSSFAISRRMQEGVAAGFRTTRYRFNFAINELDKRRARSTLTAHGIGMGYWKQNSIPSTSGQSIS
jgi:hypothetical protein